MPLHRPAPIEIELGATPRWSVIFMHGLGQRAQDMLPLVDAMDLGARVPDGVRFILPQAHEVALTISAGTIRKTAWYNVYGGELVGLENSAGMRSTQGYIHRLIAREGERGVPSHRVVLAGFSQGGVMALYIGMRYAQPLAGIVGLSGYLPVASQTLFERHAANNQTPIFAAYGTLDAIVSPTRMAPALALLTVLGYNVERHEYLMEHNVCLDEVRDLQQWLLRVFTDGARS